MDFFIIDPLLKRIRKMNKIEDKLKENTKKRQKIILESYALTEEYEQLRMEAKILKKTGKLPEPKE